MAQADLLLDGVGTAVPGHQALLRKVFHTDRPKQPQRGLEKGRQPWGRVRDLLRRQGRRAGDA